MRILVDTNILISTVLFPNSKVAKALLHITQHHDRQKPYGITRGLESQGTAVFAGCGGAAGRVIL